jgi:crotonobetainyl-CoA:carnitine CoA-transferase CaiB-like acyl-CoA transferase
MPGPLAGIRIFDLSRILAGPSATQLLGDLGAEVIKIERPGQGDDTRAWGPPFLKDEQGRDTAESAYYLSCNRSKRSLTLDIAKPEGQALARRLIAECDVVIENFKAGDLARYGLDYASLQAEFPSLVYCSITGFGQTGPYASRAGYDILIQAMGGIMSITGAPDGPPMKVGVAIVDVMCGMYACVAILAALRHRDVTGEGQFIDLALLDTQVSWLVNQGANFLVSGRVPARLGNAHPNIVPYTVMPAADGWFVLGVGNDAQYRKFCEFAGRAELAEDARFATNAARVKHRDILYPILEEVTRARPRDHWVEGLSRLGVPAGPVNDIAQVFADPQVKARGMKIAMEREGVAGGQVSMIGNPIKFSATPVDYRNPPPRLGEHTGAVLSDLLGLSPEEIENLRERGVV